MSPRAPFLPGRQDLPRWAAATAIASQNTHLYESGAYSRALMRSDSERTSGEGLIAQDHPSVPQEDNEFRSNQPTSGQDIRQNPKKSSRPQGVPTRSIAVT